MHQIIVPFSKEGRSVSMSDDVQQVPVPPSEDRPGPSSDTSKILAALGYLTGIVALIAILIEPYKDEPFVRLHAVQGLALWVAWIVASFLNIIPIIGTLVALFAYVALLVFAVMGAIKSFQGEYWEMPVLYDLVKQYV